MRSSFEDGNVPLVLHHAELWKDLPTYRHAGLPVDADEETTFSIDKPDDPIGTRPFLLVVCTGWIVTHASSTTGFSRCSSK